MGWLKRQKYKVLNSNEGKTVLSNFGYITLLQIAGYVFPLLTMPYLAKVIGASGFGKIALANAIVVWLQTIVDWGFNFSATRDVAKFRDNKDKVSSIFSNVLWSRCLLSISSAFLLSILCFLIPSFKENWLIIFLTFLMIPGHILFPDWFFQAVEKMKYMTVLNICIKFLSTIAIFVFIKEENDFILQPVISTLSYIICGLGALYIILHKWGYSIFRPNIADCISTIKSSTSIFINNMAPNLYNSFSVMLLGQFGGAHATGVFDGGNKFISIVYQFQYGLSRAFFPYLSRRSDKIKVFASINLFFSVVLAVGLFVFAPLIVRIMLSPDFKDSIIVLRILSVSFIFLGLNNTYGQNYLIVTNHEKEIRNVTLIVSLIGMAISFPMVIRFSYIGAACIILICRISIGSCAFAYYKKLSK